MDLLQQYEFDSLPYIDREYDVPQVAHAVHAMIEAEMRSFEPPKYLAHLEYPKLKFTNSIALQNEYARVVAGRPAVCLDMKRYDVDKPSTEMSVEAWEIAVNNAQVQFEHQSNRVMNLEILEERVASDWLSFNNTLETKQADLQRQIEKDRQQIDQINLSRRLDQTALLKELSRFQFRRDAAIVKSDQIGATVTTLLKQCSENTRRKYHEQCKTTGAESDDDAMEKKPRN